MKLHVLSDLHLEFAPFTVPDVGADVVILAGDIDVGLAGVRWAKTLKSRVIYVAGNHEYYGQAIPKLTDAMRAECAGSNVSVLDEEAVVVGGVRFLGATLWTDFSANGDEQAPTAKWIAGMHMTDFHRIENSTTTKTLTPDDTVAFHKRALAWLDAQLSSPFAGPTVVVTHHAPVFDANPPQYRGSELSPAFVTDLTSMMSRSRAALWVCGHTHHCVDVDKNGTRVVSNQRGYIPHEPVAEFNAGFVVDV